MSVQRYWTACQTMPGREHLIREEIEKANRGAFLPTYARMWVADGKLSARECPLVPGYVFFQTEPDAWGEIGNIEGVQRVLTTERADERRVAIRIPDSEMARLVLGHATGEHNKIEACIRMDRRKDRLRRRKPRPGRRIRARRKSSTP